MSSDEVKYPIFDDNIINLIQKTQKPDMQSNKGDTHNSSYDNYYSFEIINKYRIVDGLSLCKFD